MSKEDVPLLYWTAAAWGLAIGAAKNEPQILGDFPLVERLARRALELDEGYAQGALHELVVNIEAARPGGDLAAARKHFERAVELSGGKKAGTFVSFAESVCVKTQDSREFHRLIDRALKIDPDASPNDRLVNTLMLRKARRLKETSGDLFIDDVADSSTTSASLEDTGS